MTKLRSYPYPYKSMLSICSDLDETPNFAIYERILRYLNGETDSVLGKGIELEVGNTIYFSMPLGEFSYNSASDLEKKEIQKYIKSRHIDCVHSYGDSVRTRDEIKKIIGDLEQNNCFIDVWVDHGQAVSNIGADIMEGEGAKEGSSVYHLDITLGYGVRYFWLGRVTSIIGQSTKADYTGIIKWDSPIPSLMTVIKEIVKKILGRVGNVKYLMHSDNKLIKQSALANDVKVKEFIRSDPSYFGVGKRATPEGIPCSINKKSLRALIKKSGASIIYTHLGKIKDNNAFFTKDTIDAFRLLEEYALKKDILVATTSRLLNYIDARDNLSIVLERTGDSDVYDIKTDHDVEDLQGITLYTSTPEKCKVLINGKAQEIVFNDIDETGKRSISLPWRKLVLPIKGSI